MNWLGFVFDLSFFAFGCLTGATVAVLRLRYEAVPLPSELMPVEVKCPSPPPTTIGTTTSPYAPKRTARQQFLAASRQGAATPPPSVIVTPRAQAAARALPPIEWRK